MERTGKTIKGLAILLFMIVFAVEMAVAANVVIPDEHIMTCILVLGIIAAIVMTVLIIGFGEIVDNIKMQTQQNEEIIRLLKSKQEM